MRRLRWRRAAEPEEDERGAIIVVWAVALTAIMGLVAMSVDLGNIAQTKRHTQSAVDAAVLAGTVDLASLVPFGVGLSGSAQATAIANAEAAAVGDATTYLTNNYHLSAPDWDSCSLPAGITPYPGEDCFGFFPSTGVPYGMAVQIPTQFVKSSFGAADGFAGGHVSSIAYASVATAASSYLFPFAIATTAGPGLDCLKDGQGSGNPDPCSGQTLASGQYGFFDSPRYVIYPGHDGSSGNNTVLEDDLALGIDHFLQIYAGGTKVCDAVPNLAGCTAYNNTPPYAFGDALAVSTGQNNGSGTELGAPLFTGGVASPDGSCTFGPRLNHPDGYAATGQCSADQTPAGGFDLGTTPVLSVNTFGSSDPLNGEDIYAYLNTFGRDTYAAQCSTSLPSGGALAAVDAGNGTAWKNWDQCFGKLLSTSPPSSADPIFSADPTQINGCAAAKAPCNDIEASPRFGVVPLVDTSCTGSSCADPITGFADVYLDLAYDKGSVSGSNGKVDELQAWVFPQQWIDQPSSGSGLGGAFEPNLCAWGVNC